jgi:hypothetical protein
MVGKYDDRSSTEFPLEDDEEECEIGLPKPTEEPVVPPAGASLPVLSMRRDRFTTVLPLEDDTTSSSLSSGLSIEEGVK